MRIKVCAGLLKGNKPQYFSEVCLNDESDKAGMIGNMKPEDIQFQVTPFANRTQDQHPCLSLNYLIVRMAQPTTMLH